MGIESWSTTAASNFAGPTTVFDVIHQMMADHRARWNDAQWFEYGDGDGPATVTYVAATQFKVEGVDVSAAYHVDRRVKVVAKTPGTIYGTITAVSFSTDTTVTVAFDSGSLSDQELTVSLAILTATNKSFVSSGGGGASGGHGQCRLTKSGGDLLLSPKNGNKLIIDGSEETVPSAGVTLAATGLTIDTDHFVYAYMNAGTMTLEASTTGHAADATTGVEIISGDSTRTLVGLARPITGPAWVDTATQRFVISWFNRRTITARKDYSTNVTTTSTSEIELSTNYRAEFLIWDDEMPLIAFSGRMENVTAPNYCGAIAALDTTNVSGQCIANSSTNSAHNPVAPSGSPTSAAEGYHYSTLRGKVSGGTTGTWSIVFNTTMIRG